jgi:hypothetical protein
MGRRRTAVAAFVAAIVIAATQASSASAQFETFMGQQGLSAGNAYASASAHTYVYRIETDSDHTRVPRVFAGLCRVHVSAVGRRARHLVEQCELRLRRRRVVALHAGLPVHSPHRLQPQRGDVRQLHLGDLLVVKRK